MPNLEEKSVPFVFATGYGEEIDLPSTGARLNAIKKPFSNEQLVSAVQAVLKP